ncbi:MAG: hypothetical protein WCH86_01620 [Kiritimatiellales bacterium]
MEKLIHIIVPIAGGLFLILTPWLGARAPVRWCKAGGHPRFKIGAALAGCFWLASGTCKILIASTSLELSPPTLAWLEYFRFIFSTIAVGNLLILLLFANVGFENKENK